MTQSAIKIVLYILKTLLLTSALPFTLYRAPLLVARFCLALVLEHSLMWFFFTPKLEFFLAIELEFLLAKLDIGPTFLGSISSSQVILLGSL